MLEKFKDYPSVKVIKENVSTESLFHFTETSVSEMTRELSSLNSKKAGPFGNILTKVLKISSDICNKLLQKIWNSEIFGKVCFPQNLKLSTHIDRFLSAYLCGYRKWFSTQFALISLIGKWRKYLDNRVYTGQF